MNYHIIERLTDPERRVVLAAGDEFAKFPKAMGLPRGLRGWLTPAKLAWLRNFYRAQARRRRR